MKKFKEFMDKPMTWGGYTKFTVIVGVVSMIITAGSYGFIFRDEIKDKFEDLVEKIHTR